MSPSQGPSPTRPCPRWLQLWLRGARTRMRTCMHQEERVHPGDSLPLWPRLPSAQRDTHESRHWAVRKGDTLGATRGVAPETENLQGGWPLPISPTLLLPLPPPVAPRAHSAHAPAPPLRQRMENWKQRGAPKQGGGGGLPSAKGCTNRLLTVAALIYEAVWEPGQVCKSWTIRRRAPALSPSASRAPGPPCPSQAGPAPTQTPRRAPRCGA